MSILAALVGVQSEKNRERDFKRGDIKVFIIAGIVTTAVLVLLMALIVSQVLKNVSA